MRFIRFARVWSEVDHNFTKSLSYKKDQQEGKTQKMIDVSFDYQKQSYYSENGSKPIVLNLEESVFDPMAITYAFRMNEMVSVKREQFQQVMVKNYYKLKSMLERMNQ